MVLMGTTGSCLSCDGAPTTFRRFKDKAPHRPDRDAPLRCSRCRAPYEKAYVSTTHRPLMSSRHVRDFYAEGHEVTQLSDGKGGHPVVHSRGEMQRLWEKNGLDPDTGAFRPYGEGGEDFN